MIVNGKEITVKDAIKFEANTQGAVHLRDADLGKEEEEKMAKEEKEDTPSLDSISLGSFSVGGLSSYKSAEVDSSFSVDDLAQAWTGEQEEDEFSFY